MPILQNVLVSHDQKVVEQGCLCVTRVIDSFKHSPEKLEELVDPPLLKLILGLLLPGTTNLIGASIHTEFLRVLAIVARSSPQLSADLLKMNVVDTLYQILTGVSPPDETTDAASKIDSVVIMQALIHRPREQVFETLNVVCELLPKPADRNFFFNDHDGLSEISDSPRRKKSKPSFAEKRMKLLADCRTETRRFAMILLPTLTDAYSSTVNLSVRQKVLTAQLKILSNLEISVIEEALRPVPYASFLASILSQEDHPSLVMFALQASELLFERLGDIYQYQFHREGVISEIQRIAERKIAHDVHVTSSPRKSLAPSTDLLPTAEPQKAVPHQQELADHAEAEALYQPAPNEQHEHSEHDDEDHDQDDHDEEEDDEEEDDHNDDDNNEDNEEDDDEADEIHVREENGRLSESPSSDSELDLPSTIAISGVRDVVVLKAKKFLEVYDITKEGQWHGKADQFLRDLQNLAGDIKSCYLEDGSGDGIAIFGRLAKFFDGDALESITSSELLTSGIIEVLLDVFGTSPNKAPIGTPKADFLHAFLGTTISSKIKSAGPQGSATPFSVLIQKLQDLLSRTEHFEVLTTNSNYGESGRSSSTSVLSKQLRLKLTADESSEIPIGYRDITVSIHAIATFKALDDYLRPRISLSERPSSKSQRREMMAQIANARMRELSNASDPSFLRGLDASSLLPFMQHPGSTAKPRTPRASSRANETLPTTPDVTKAAKDEKTKPRRSSRRHQAPLPTEEERPSSSSEKPRAPGTPIADKLEVADEKHFPEGESELSMSASRSAMRAMVDALDDDMSDDDAPDPSAINVEVASNGKVTARTEDGTRVATPLQPGTPVSASGRPPPSGLFTGTPGMPPGPFGLSSRPSSYAAALAAIPQDWHIEFSIDGKPIPKETTVYRAVYHNREVPQDPAARNIWSGIHGIKFKRVKGPPTESMTIKGSTDSPVDGPENGLPDSLNAHPITSSILSLLSTLYELNANPNECLVTEIAPKVQLKSEPVAQFINTKLTAKINRQLEEPLIVASNCLPTWSEDLARLFPFLFPFETRHLFLQSTSFGYSRSMIRWQNAQTENDDRRDRRRDDRPIMGRLQRQKVRISRNRILESAVKVMEHYGASPSVLEVEYFEEVGTGLGPTLEFYSTISKELSKKKLKLWRENESNVDDEYAFGKLGLFPTPMTDSPAQLEANTKALKFFNVLGTFVARSMLDSRIIDVSFNPSFFRLGPGSKTKPSLPLIRTVDADLANSLSQVQQFARQKMDIEDDDGMSTQQKQEAMRMIQVRGAGIDDLMLDFTLPGYPSIELVPSGSNTPVTINNVQEYVDKVIDMTLGKGVNRQIEAFRTGFSQVFSYTSLKAFTPQELVMLFGRVEEDWSMETLMETIKADHGFNMDSKSVKNLLQTMSELTPSQRRDFLQFVTGSPKLPIGGKLPILYSRLCPLLICCRLQESHSDVHRRLQAIRAPVQL